MLEISRTFELQAAHRLPHTPPSHKCNRMHGHTWNVRVVITGPIHPVYGWIIDYATMDALWVNKVHRKLDHTVLNDTIPNPTTECIAGWIYAALQPEYAKAGCRILRIDVGEGNLNCCTLVAEQPEVPS